MLLDTELVPSGWEAFPGGEVWRGLLSHSHVLDLSFAYCSRGFLRCLLPFLLGFKVFIVSQKSDAVMMGIALSSSNRSVTCK